jgi:hypothetical protein
MVRAIGGLDMKRILGTVLVFAMALFVFAADASTHRVCTSTGAVAMASSCKINDITRVKQVTVKFSSAPTTSEPLTISLNSVSGSDFDVLLYTVDPSVAALTSIVWVPDGGAMILLPGDSLDVAYTNTDTRTYGVIVYYELNP